MLEVAVMWASQRLIPRQTFGCKWFVGKVLPEEPVRPGEAGATHQVGPGVLEPEPHGAEVVLPGRMAGFPAPPGSPTGSGLLRGP